MFTPKYFFYFSEPPPHPPPPKKKKTKKKKTLKFEILNPPKSPSLGMYEHIRALHGLQTNQPSRHREKEPQNTNRHLEDN